MGRCSRRIRWEIFLVVIFVLRICLRRIGLLQVVLRKERHIFGLSMLHINLINQNVHILVPSHRMLRA